MRSYIASAIGESLYAGDKTETGKRLNFAKICVEIKVDSPLLETVDVEYANGHTATVNIKYPWAAFSVL